MLHGNQVQSFFVRGRDQKTLDDELAAILKLPRRVRDLGTRTCDLKRWLTNWGGPDGIVAFRNAAGGFMRVTPVEDQAPVTGTPAGGHKPSVYVPDSDCGSAR